MISRYGLNVGQIRIQSFRKIECITFYTLTLKKIKTKTLTIYKELFNVVLQPNKQMHFITPTQFKRIIEQDTISAYINGKPASFMFDNSADELNVYHTEDDEEFVETVSISDNKLIATFKNEVLLKANGITDAANHVITIVLFKEVPLIPSEEIDRLRGKY